jgi:hypothetical protein
MAELQKQKNEVQKNEVQKNEVQRKEEEEYKAQLTDLQKKAMRIAQDHLQSSFTLSETIGFLKWKETRAASAASAAKLNSTLATLKL